ncbi:MAG: endo-1,4-beta-xylanase [Beijerinckiaceae bacterium]|nr:endo-1,4-beta-xylanase [Beijerinckiaceae bacterium]
MTGNGLSRRSLFALGGAGTVAAVAGDAPAIAAPPSACAEDYAALPPLKRRPSAWGTLFGATSNASRIPKEQAYFARLASEVDLYTPESNFQWSLMETAKGKWDFRTTDIAAGFARANKIGMVGHALVYFYFVPAWLKAETDADTISQAISERVSQTMGRYRSQIARWDVVNEPLRIADGLDGDLRRFSFQQALGEKFIDLAFAEAKRTDPSVLLCLNEAEFEYQEPGQLRKRDSLLALLRRLKERGAPVDVLGLQSHLYADKPLDITGLQSFLKDVSRLGIKLAVTELDVCDDKLPADPDTRDMMVADHARRYLDVVRSSGELVSVTTWGFSDRYTWLDMWHVRKDGMPLRPLAFDFDLRRKRLWKAIADIVKA